MSKTCLYETRDHIAIVTLNRPEKLNAFNRESYQATTNALQRADADPDVRCIVLTGAGRGFCSGDDVAELMGGDGLANVITQLELPGPTMRQSRTPIIAAVNGAAVGYGFQLALMADIRIAASTARFSQMFIQRGLIAGVDSFRILTQLCGPDGAAELLLTGDVIDAQRAAELLLTGEVIDVSTTPALSYPPRRSPCGVPPPPPPLLLASPRADGRCG